MSKTIKSDDFKSSPLMGKTTKEISDDYNHKAPDSLLDGDELWFSVDSIKRTKEEAINMLNITKGSKEYCRGYKNALVFFEVLFGEATTERQGVSSSLVGRKSSCKSNVVAPKTRKKRRRG